MAFYYDTTQCPRGHPLKVRRRSESVGRMIATHCPQCNEYHKLLAGPVPVVAGRSGKYRHAAPTREAHIEHYLVKRAKEVGGEVRKVKWIGRNSAPDRLLMLPKIAVYGFDPVKAQAQYTETTIWVELKAPGKAATFPSNPHEHAQHREHERMRKMGQRVEVIDSYEQVEELFK